MKEWTLSREQMPEFDGMYLVAGWEYHECGNITPFMRTVECKMNQWVKAHSGLQMTYWRELFVHPDVNQFETYQSKEPRHL